MQLDDGYLLITHHRWGSPPHLWWVH